MAWSDDAADVIDGAYEAFGAAATYIAPGSGVPLPCTVIGKSADRVVSFGDGRPFAEGTVIEVRAAEIAAPAKGGAFTPGKIVNGVFVPGPSSFAVLGDPELLDDLRMVWTCRVN